MILLPFCINCKNNKLIYTIFTVFKTRYFQAYKSVLRLRIATWLNLRQSLNKVESVYPTRSLLYLFDWFWLIEWVSLIEINAPRTDVPSVFALGQSVDHILLELYHLVIKTFANTDLISEGLITPSIGTSDKYFWLFLCYLDTLFLQ